ncbi:NAD-dependent protein deacylase 1 [Betaproteobacteria bacterium]|nr:NAD-dependent protein deacylase 1 [Betaproteobacteria bacterium]
MNTNTSQEMPVRLSELLSRRFERIVVLSGAGMSADSGIPTFRSGSNGLWHEFNPSDLATPEAWEDDKALVWGWYEWRRGLVMAARPNPGHVAIGELQRLHGTSVITQNVDDLHERGGATGVLHLHGSLFAARCDTCGAPHVLGDPPSEIQRQVMPPRCPYCDGYIRPGVVWFGEDLDPEVLDNARERIAACDLLLIVGTSSVVYPAAGLSGYAPNGATIIEINPQPGPSLTDYQWQTTAAIGLPLLLDALNHDQGGEK